jgi:hypothetical protein
MTDEVVRVGLVVFFIVVFVLPIVQIAIIDRRGKVRPFDSREDK